MFAHTKRRNVNALPVVFRVDTRKKQNNALSAWFPTLPGTRDPETRQTYEHVGQHGSGHMRWYRECTRPATPDEYAPLLAELRGIYECDPSPFELVVVARMTDYMRDEYNDNVSGLWL